MMINRIISTFAYICIHWIRLHTFVYVGYAERLHTFVYVHRAKEVAEQAASEDVDSEDIGQRCALCICMYM